LVEDEVIHNFNEMEAPANQYGINQYVHKPPKDLNELGLRGTSFI